LSCRSPYIVNRCGEIDKLIGDSIAWSDNDPKLAAHLAAYISVLIVGILEDCIEHLVASRAGKANDPEIHNYIKKIISQRFRNPDYPKIADVLLDFSPAYRDTFKGHITPSGTEANALQSLVDNKNSLAHVGTAKLNLTLGDVRSYYNQSLLILQALENILM